MSITYVLLIGLTFSSAVITSSNKNPPRPDFPCIPDNGFLPATDIIEVQTTSNCHPRQDLFRAKHMPGVPSLNVEIRIPAFSATTLGIDSRMTTNYTPNSIGGQILQQALLAASPLVIVGGHSVERSFRIPSPGGWGDSTKIAGFAVGGSVASPHMGQMAYGWQVFQTSRTV